MTRRPWRRARGLRGERCGRVPWIIGNEFYVNMASQVLIYALFALSINMMLGYGGMVSLGHAGLSRNLTGYRLHPADRRPATTSSPQRSVRSCSRPLRRAVRRAGAARAGLGFLMITLALGQIVWGVAYRANDAHRRRQRHPPSGPPAAVRLRHPRCASSFYYFTLVVFAIACSSSGGCRARRSAPA